MQDSIRKLTEQANLQKPIQPPIDSLIRRIALGAPTAEYSPDKPPAAVVVSVVCILSVSSIAFYFYRRK
jgi:hypothetical protein